MADAKLVVQIDGQDNLSDELKKIESGVIRFVGAVSSALTAISAFAFPVIGAAQFQKELLNAAKTTNFTRDQLLELKGGLSELSKQVNVTAVDLAKIATMGGQIGLGDSGPAGLLEFTKTVSTAVSALDLDAETVVASVGKLINIFDIKPTQFRNTVSALNEVSNESNATADQLFDVVRRIGNLGGSVKLPEAAALSATLIDLGLTAETAGTTITKIFADFKSDASSFSSVVKNDSIRTTKDWIDLVQNDGLGALTAYIDALNKLDVENASATKGRLTGEGRLFEAITKLQEQRKRELVLIGQKEKIQKRIVALENQGAKEGDPALKGLQAQAKALEEAAVQANVLARLRKSAQEAYDAGNSAEKEQRTVLGGLSAQWQVFLNNVKALAVAAGDTFLPPLTAALRALSSELGDAVNADSLRRAGEDILSAVRTVIGAFQEIRNALSALGSSGIDWGAILRLTALVTAFAVLKGFISLVKSLGVNMLAAVPPLNALGAALFGAVQATDQAGRGMQQTGQSVQRVGGLFQNVAASVRGSVEAIAASSQRLSRARELVGALLSSAQQRQQTAQQQVTNVLGQRRLAQLQTEAAIQQRIATQQQAIAAAQAAGQTARARSLKGDVTYLTNQLTALQAAQGAASRYTAVVEYLGKRLGNIDKGLSRISVAGQFTNLVRAAQDAGTRMASGIATNFNRGVQAGLGPQIRSTFGGLFNTVSDVAVTAGQRAASLFASGFNALRSGGPSTLNGVARAFDGVRTAAQSAGTAIKGTVASVRGLGASGVAAGALGTVTGLAQALGSLATRGAGAAGGGAASLFSSIVQGAGRATLAISGYGDAWQRASTNTAKGAVIAGAALNLFARGVGLAVKGLLGLVNVAFFGLFIVDLLKAIGLWDRLAESIGRAAKAMGFNVPNFLKSDKELRAQAAEVKRINDAFDASSKSAARFDAVMKGIALTAENVEQITKDLTFNPKAPEVAQKSANEYFDALVTGYSKVSSIQGSLLKIELDIEAARKRVAEFTPLRRQTQASPEEILTGTGEVSQQAKEAQAALDSLLAKYAELKAEKDSLSGLTEGLRNFAKAHLTAAEASALLATNTQNGTSALTSYASNLIRLRDLEAQKTAAEADLAQVRSNGGAATSDAERQNQQYQTTVNSLTVEIEKLTQANSALERNMLRGEAGAGRLASIFERLKSESSPQAVLDTALAFQTLAKELDGFQGNSIPKINADDVFQAAAAVEVYRRVSSMYTQWTAAARTAADRAKNYAAQVQGEIQKLLRDTSTFIDRITQTAQQKAQLARNQTQDRTDDAASRQTLRNLQTQYDVERALLEQQFAQQQRVFAEQESGGRRVFFQKQQAYALEQQALFQLEEKYNKLRQAEEDRLNIQKQRRGVQQELRDFDELIKKIEFYKKRAEEANKVIADPNASAQDRAASIEKRTVALDKLRSTYALIEGAAERLANKDPIGGQVIVKPEELDRVKQAVDATAKSIGKVSLEGANALEKATETVANSLAAGATEYGNKLAAAVGVFNQLAEKQNLSAEAAGAIVSRVSEISELITRVQNQTQNGLLNFGTIDADAIRGQAELAFRRIGAEAARAFEGLSQSTVPITLTVDQAATQTEFVRAVTAAKQQVNAAPVSVAARIADSSINSMREQIQGIKPVIDATLNVTKVNGTKGTFTLEGRKRGGLMGDVISMGTGIARFASGGRVKGPGGPTDDRIFAALSHGEYVMDALTTARFGPKFFSTLQAMARGGLSANFLSRFSLPKFATGGPVGTEVLSGISGIANDFNSSGSGVATPQRDVVDINLSDGTRRATIQAEREQARSLVSILSSFQKGR